MNKMRNGVNWREKMNGHQQKNMQEKKLRKKKTRESAHKISTNEKIRKLKVGGLDRAYPQPYKYHVYLLKV